jgi:putative heme-binding domain-containing protein
MILQHEIACGFLCLLATLPLGAQIRRSERQPTTRASQGQKTFASTCAGCHGLDGRGSDRAPDVVGSPKVQHLSDAAIRDIVSNGIPGTGMPASHSLSSADVRSLVKYLRVLQGRNANQSLTGHPEHGKAIFFGKGQCSSCHMVEGNGGFIAPDLSAYAVNHSSKEILEAITHSGTNANSPFRIATVLTRNGQRLIGTIRNEDNFSLQLQTADGVFHFLNKSELQTVEDPPQSSMMTKYAERLTRKELNDLAAYLMQAGQNAIPASASHDEDQ